MRNRYFLIWALHIHIFHKFKQEKRTVNLFETENKRKQIIIPAYKNKKRNSATKIWKNI